MTEYYKSKRPVDGKPPIWVIVDETGKIVNRNPSKYELKGLKIFPEKIIRGGSKKYIDEELLDYLIQFYKKYGKPPGAMDFLNNPEYPNYGTYQKRFGSWSNALKLVGLDVDSMVKKGVLITCQQKARLAEIKVINHFKQHPIDLSGENQNSPCDGICYNNKTYDVKSSKLHKDTHYSFNTNNKHKDEIEIYYFLAFNEDYSKLEYAWRIPGEIVEKDYFRVGLNPDYEFDVEDMDKYDITEKIKEIIYNKK